MTKCFPRKMKEIKKNFLPRPKIAFLRAFWVVFLGQKVKSWGFPHNLSFF